MSRYLLYATTRADAKTGPQISERMVDKLVARLGLEVKDGFDAETMVTLVRFLNDPGWCV